MGLPERLRQLKIQNNLLQKEIAVNVNMSLRTYQRYENGEREPTMTALIDMAKYFDVSIDFLVGRSDDPNFTPRKTD